MDGSRKDQIGVSDLTPQSLCVFLYLADILYFYTEISPCSQIFVCFLDDLAAKCDLSEIDMKNQTRQSP